MLGQPALVASHVGGDAQRKTFFAQQSVAAVARAVRPDFAGLRVMHDVLGAVARPSHIFLPGGQRRTDGVNARYKVTIFTQHIEHRFAHAGHDALVHRHVSAVRQFDTDVGDGRAQRSHAERHHIHGAPFHAAVKQRLQSVAHFGGGHPVIGRTGLFFFLGTNIGAVFYPGHVAGVGASQKRIGPLGRVELFEGTGVDQLLAQALVLFFTAVAPIDLVGFAQGDHFIDPGNEPGVLDISG